MIKAVAIDDEPMALEIVRMHLSKIPFIELKCGFVNAFKAADYLKTEAIDLLFVDIQMPDISGIEFVKHLEKKPMIIFVTAYSEYAVKGFEVEALDYLLKPFSAERFANACQKALAFSELKESAKKDEFIFLKTGYEQIRLKLNDIYYLESAGNYVSFITKDKRTLARMKFTEVNQLLPERKFIRVHRRYIVAIDKIEKVERHQIVIRNNVVPVSDNYACELFSLMGSSRTH